MKKVQGGGIAVGEYKIKTRSKRVQGKYFKNTNKIKNASKVFVAIGLIMLLIVSAVILGFSSTNLTTFNKLNGRVSVSSAVVKPYKAMVTIETKTKRILSSFNETEKLPMASTTKIMTAIVAIEAIQDINKEFIIPNEAVGIEGSSMYLRKGEKLTLEELLYGLMLPSANDGAVALAIICAGSESNFANLMNEKAKEIGAVNTHFVTASGLHDVNHYTTAYDLALISAYAMQNPIFKKIVGTKSVMVKGSDPDKPRFLKNKQHLFEDKTISDLGITITGVKTGFTPEAGRCLVSSATKNGLDTITVVLNAPDMFKSSADIIKEVYGSYTMVSVLPPKKHISTVICKNGESSQINIYSAQGFEYPASAGEIGKIKIKYNYPSVVLAPIEKDQKIGEVEVLLNNEVIFKTDILSIEEVKKTKVDNIFKKIIENF